jgi:hypothetical protein
MNDESNNNNLYLLMVVLVLGLVVLAYSRVPAFRQIVNAKAPWFNEKVGHYLVSAKPGGDPKASDGDAPAPKSFTGPQGFDLAAFSAHPDSWPANIAIKTETVFPAVLNNKVVGSVRAPAGSQVHLMKVENGKLGVEYQGGGAWVKLEATDLVERVESNVASHP